MKKLLFIASLLATIVGWSDPITYTFTGNTGWVGNYGHNINGATDASGAAMWSSGAAADPNCSYRFGKKWTAFYMGSASKFNGGELIVADNGFMELLFAAGNGGYPTDCTIDNLTVDAGAKLKIEERQWKWTTTDRNLNGDSWKIDGDLEISLLKSEHRFCLKAPLSGSGTVTFTDAGGEYLNSYNNQALAADNSAYLGKFAVSLANISQDEANARGLEISQASALGGALDVATPDALTLDSGSGLVATDTLTLDTANRGIDLKANAFFDVVDGKTLTVKEPIRSEGGFYKRGAGTLALDSAITFGADGTAEPDGANNALSIKAGVLRVVSSTATKDLDVVFSPGAALELDIAAAQDGFPCRSLSSVGLIDVVVDFSNTGYEPGSSHKVLLFTLPEANARAVADKLNVCAKGGLSIPGVISTGDAEAGRTSVFATVTVPQPLTAVTYTGTGGLNSYWTTGGNDLNAERDIDSPSMYLWSDQLAAHPEGAYRFNFGKWAYFSSKSSDRFNGGALEIASGHLELKLTNPETPARISSYAIDNLVVDAGAKFQFDGTTYMWWQPVTTVTGNCWSVNGDLVIAPLKNYVRFSLAAPLAGSGLVTFGGYKDGDWSASHPQNQVLASDNRLFRGKFLVSLAETDKGGDFYARGVEIASANALGGAMAEPTADALTLAGWNGLIATETLTLDAINRGITLKDNAFFEVFESKTLTVAEPIVAEGGFFKCGAGTLAIGASAVVCAEETPFRVAAGAVRPTGKLGLGKLKTTFAEGAALEVDAFESDPAVVADGFYQPSGWTVEGGKLNVNIIFPDGYELEQEKTIVLATVPQASAQALADNMKINQIGLAHRRSKKIVVEPAGDGLAKIVLVVKRAGLCISIK